MNDYLAQLAQLSSLYGDTGGAGYLPGGDIQAMGGVDPGQMPPEAEAMADTDPQQKNTWQQIAPWLGNLAMLGAGVGGVVAQAQNHTGSNTMQTLRDILHARANQVVIPPFQTMGRR